MANIDRIVNVEIALRTAAVTTMSFSDLLLLGTFVPQAGERVVIITDADQLLQDYGVNTGSPLYKAAQVCFSQIPTIPQLFIGNKNPVGLPPVILTLTGILPYYMEVGAPGDANVPFTCYGTNFTPASKIRFGNVVEENTIYVNDTTLTINITRSLFTNPDASIPVSIFDPNLGETNPLSFQVVPVGTADPGPALPPPPKPLGNPAQLMATIAAENTDWYGFVDTDHNEAEVLDFAAWAEASQKLFLAVLSSDDNITPPQTDVSSIAHQLHNGSFFRTAWWWNPDPLEFTDVAITARSFTKYPGGETWANQRLNAVTATQLNEVTARNIHNKDGNTFEPFRNINISQRGRVAGGEWIDIIRFRDWLCEEIRINIFSHMIDNRIPFTDPGIASIKVQINKALDLGVARGGIAPPEVNSNGDLVPSYTVTMPLSLNVPFNDKANRILRDCRFTARLTGAIHVVEVKGVLTYNEIA